MFIYSLKEVELNLSLFLLGGYESTGSSISYSIYVLATNQEEQARVRQEIDDHFPFDSEVILAEVESIYMYT